MKTLSISTSIVLAVVALVLGAYSVFQTSPKAEAVGYAVTSIGAATTTAAINVTSSTRILATTTNALGNGTSYTREYAVICNPSATPVYISLNNDKITDVPSGKFTTVIAAAAGFNACYEIQDFNQYSGSITASSTNQTSVIVQVADYVQ